MKKQIKFVAVRPNGTVCGPIGDTWDDVGQALRVGHERAGGSGKWEDIAKQGYTVRRAEIKLIKDWRKRDKRDLGHD